MRIIAGKYRGRKLKSPPSLATRPTSDRLRETLFNILAPRIKGARFLDLCAGTGAVGIEALSRGAVHATFVDQSRKMCKLIRSNVDALNLDEDEFEIVIAEASQFLRKRAREKTESFDVVYFDPPYAADYNAVLKDFGEHPTLLREDGVLIVEHRKKKDLSQDYGLLHRHRVLRQGDSVLSFYRLPAV
jgi:16S rRNA (guanine966-N2)-methyltransferase